ncbi:EF-hand domain-containing protein [Marinobacter mobilis]|uniref:EF-hand domain-containing protein n=1 Tax=Marinobacter mobilis TaxID=488533 RepID=A0A1H2WY40_9GAMM|nr:EF-hand domain-containing protein [Marinobacter mobilis]SDW84879.1 hypothetical protein SAMN04487960_104302 [Marinobacter mobilis]
MNGTARVGIPLLLAFVITGCAGYGGVSDGTESEALAGVGKAQFDCANRNGSEYIESAELVFLVQCGAREGQPCGNIPEDRAEAASSREVFRQGRRLLEIMDLNLDSRISKLEFRAFCNQAL